MNKITKIILITISTLTIAAVCYPKDYSKWCNKYNPNNQQCVDEQLSAKHELQGILISRMRDNEPMDDLKICSEKHTEKDDTTNWIEVLKCVKSN